MKKFLISTGILALAFGANAQGDVYEQREELMESFGGAMKAMSEMAQGKKDFDQARVEEALMTLHDGSMQIIDVFPEGTNAGDSEAKDTIWSQSEKFQETVDDFILRTTPDPVPTNTQELGVKLSQLGGGCKACHSDFRVDD